MYCLSRTTLAYSAIIISFYQLCFLAYGMETQFVPINLYKIRMAGKLREDLLKEVMNWNLFELKYPKESAASKPLAELLVRQQIEKKDDHSALAGNAKDDCLDDCDDVNANKYFRNPSNELIGSLRSSQSSEANYNHLRSNISQRGANNRKTDDELNLILSNMEKLFDKMNVQRKKSTTATAINNKIDTYLSNNDVRQSNNNVKQSA